MPAPKRPLTGYFRFAATVRASLEKKHRVSGIKTAPYVSAAWKALSEEKRGKFNAQAVKEMGPWKKKMEAYKKTAEYKEAMQAKKAKKFKKKPKDTNAPKRPLSAYFLFGATARPALMKKHNNDVSVVMKKIAVQWNALGEAEKAKFQKKTDAARAKYDKQVATYQKSAKYQAYQKTLADFQAKKREHLGKPAAKKAKK